MAITHPKLPPQKGYVEVEVAGKRTYRNVETNMLIEDEIAASIPSTPAQQREVAYNSQALIEWDGEMLTVTQAATMWQYYAAEGSEKANELQTLIATAKQNIREQFPEKEVE